jgi:hypothetical protein
VYMPWAMARGNPNALAAIACKWIGLTSMDTAGKHRSAIARDTNHQAVMTDANLTPTEPQPITSERDPRNANPNPPPWLGSGMPCTHPRRRRGPCFRARTRLWSRRPS